MIICFGYRNVVRLELAPNSLAIVPNHSREKPHLGHPECGVWYLDERPGSATNAVPVIPRQLSARSADVHGFENRFVYPIIPPPGRPGLPEYRYLCYTWVNEGLISRISSHTFVLASHRLQDETTFWSFQMDKGWTWTLSGFDRSVDPVESLSVSEVMGG